MTNYPYVDIAVLDSIRRSFAAGDALVIVVQNLSQVIWANGSGLELFGLGRLDAALNGEALLDEIQQRQIAGVLPSIDDERVVHLRFVQGPQTVLLPVHVSIILLPDNDEAVLLRIPFMALESRTKTSDTLDAIRRAGSHAAFIKPGARLISGADDLAALDIDPEDLARMMREVAGENDRLVKRQLRTARGDLPAALARLTDEDGLHLLVVIEPEEAAVGADVVEPAIAEEAIIEDDAAPTNTPTISSFWIDEPDQVESRETPPREDDFESDPLGEQRLPNLISEPATPALSPVRFAWKTDADGRFLEMSEAFLHAVGLTPGDINGQNFRSLAVSIGIADETNVADLFDRQSTWSGRSVLWPVKNTNTAIPVELAGLPMFARDRVFEGYRGFGVARPELAVEYVTVPIQRNDSADTNVVPFGRRTTAPAVDPIVPALDDNEREAFAEIGARLRDQPSLQNDPPSEDGVIANYDFSDDAPTNSALPLRTVENVVTAEPIPQNQIDGSIFSKLPLPVLVYTGEALHFANTAFLELSGYNSLGAIIDAGGLDALFGDGSNTSYDEDNTSGMHLIRADGSDIPVSAHLQSVPWGDSKALMLAIAARNGTVADVDSAERQLFASGNGVENNGPQMAAAQQQIEELTAILDTATDGVVVLDATGNIRSLNNAAQALFGYDEAEVAGQPLNALLAIESHRASNDYMAGLLENGVVSVLNDGRDMIGREREGRFIPIFVNIARLSSSEGFCAVIRDVTNWKRAEEQLTSARRDAESASSNKTEFLARMSHEIRTPLNAIIGFSDVMMNERFGPLGNARYKDYLQDIHRSGNLVLSLVNDLLDISKIEAGGQSFDFRAIELNSIVEEAVAMMQPQANRERVLIRTSFGYDLPQLVADERSIKQIVLNLLSNAIRFTDAGGQVIVSTNYETNGDLTLKVRDTGIGMNENELEDALRPYRQIGQKPESEAGGTGLGLPLARALAESNKGDFRIRSTPGEGTVIEIAFPASRVLAG